MSQAGLLTGVLEGLLLLALGLVWVTRRRARRALAAAQQAFQAMADRLQAQIQELEASRSQVAGILHSMEEGVLAVGPQGELRLINPGARMILGIEPGIGPGAAAGELIRQPELRDLLAQTLATGHVQIQDLTLYAPAERHLRVHATTCQLPEGRGALLVLHDITDLKRLEHLRRDFVANVSHELKTPLTAIRGAVETLLEGAAEDPQHRQTFVASLAEESARLNRLVDDLLALARIESQPVAHRQPLSIGEFLEAEIARYRRAAEAQGITLTLEAPPAQATVLADRDQLAQAVGNLLDNAIKYNRPGGRVTVRAVAQDRQLWVEVEDTGIGIPADDLPRIFERFYRVDKARSRATGGTGLGLSIVKHVAEAHGGAVSVESQLGRGACFTLTLPLA